MNFMSLRFLGKKSIVLCLIIASVFACQEESNDITPTSNQEVITPNSSLAIMLQNTATLDGSLDNVIDNANCILINLPVNVEVNGVSFLIDNVGDYQVVEAVLNEFTTSEGNLEIVFPITITLNDYTQIVIANYDELETFINECSGENEADDDIECIDFQYPITFSTYDANFQIAETVVINNDEALYSFIENLEGGILTSLNFPITMILSDGSTVEVNSNQELETTISEAEDDCDEDDDNDWNDNDTCSISDVEANLIECEWTISNYNNETGFNIFNIDFMDNDTATIASLNESYIMDWYVSLDEDIYLVLYNVSGGNVQVLNGDYILVECTPNQLVFQDLSDMSVELVLDKDCEQGANPFQCFEDLEAVFVGCDDDNDGFGEFYLAPIFETCQASGLFEVTYHETLVDAQANVNMLASPYSNIIAPAQNLYARVELLNTGEFQVFEVALTLENCNASGCTESEVDAYLVECLWNVVNLNGNDDLVLFDLDFDANGTVIITGNGQTTNSTWSTSQTDDGIWVEFNGVNAGNIQAISGNWLIVECETDRLQMNQGNNTMVIEQDCTTDSNCNVNDVETNLMDCEWTISSYNNESSFSVFNIDFQANGQAIIYTPNSTQDYSANWTVSLDGGIYLDFSNISGGNVQVLNGNYILVECTPDQMIFHDPSNTNIELILDKDCD